MSTFRSAKEIHDVVYQGKGYSILASIWENDSEGGYRRYKSEHIPTAHFCDPSAALTGLPGSKAGRNPLPDIADVQRSIEFWGLRQGYPAVVYDQGHGLFAGRAWWVLRWAGIEDVSILDGGLKAWETNGGPIVGGPGNISMRSDARAQEGCLPVATMEDVRNHKGVLVDTRQPNRFAGRRERLDLKAGHIPGAVNIPLSAFFHEGRFVKSPAEIRQALADKGITSTEDMIIYSGSGNHSSLAIAALEHAGFDIPAHYVGGWSQWSANPRNPVERGD